AETAEPRKRDATAVPPTESSPLQLAVQRAIAAAETAAPIERDATAVSPIDSSPLQPAIQRAIAAAETAEPIVKAETAVPPIEPASPQTSIQRAIAATETAPVRDTPTPPPIIRMASGAHRVPGSPGGGVPEVVARMDTRPLALEPASQASPAADKVGKTAVAVQRAITAAETAPGRSDISFRARVVQPDPTAPLRRMESTARPLSRPEIPMARVIAAPASSQLSMPSGRQPHAPAFQTPGGWSPALVQRAVARAEAPIAEAPLADGPLADAPLADAPLTDAPLFDGRLADSPLTEFSAGAWVQPGTSKVLTAVAVKPPTGQPGTATTATAVQRAVARAETAVAPLWEPLPAAVQRQEAIDPLAVRMERETAVVPQPASPAVPRSALKTTPSVLEMSVQRALGDTAEQNADETNLAESEPESSPMQPSIAQELDQEEEELDVNELARQVYDKLRRRLTIDRERERGRY
nr:hypothetical protein [Chloroflexota bacterium]